MMELAGLSLVLLALRWTWLHARHLPDLTETLSILAHWLLVAVYWFAYLSQFIN